MFEKFIEKKTLSEKEIILNLDAVSRENILNSDLSDFSKSYILYDFKEELSKDDLSSRVEKSNKLFFNYTIRPKWTLINFLFSNFESRPPNEILKKINIFPFYKFYTEAIEQFIRDNFQIFVTKNEMTSIIDDTNKAIYDKLVNDASGLKIKNFFLQIFKLKYENESDYNLESTVPYPLVKIFLDDKQYHDLEKKLRVLKVNQEDEEISLIEIIKVLTDKYHVKEIKKETKSEVKNESKSLSENNLTSKSDNEIIIPENLNEKNIPDIVIKTKSDLGPIYSDQLVEADKEIVKETEKVRSEKDIISNSELNILFDEKHIEKIINKVYNSNEIYKDISFGKLNNYRTWFEASNHLKEIFENNKVDIYNKDVISFVNVLNEYFQSKE